MGNFFVNISTMQGFIKSNGKLDYKNFNKKVYEGIVKEISQKNKEFEEALERVKESRKEEKESEESEVLFSPQYKGRHIDNAEKIYKDMKILSGKTLEKSEGLKRLLKKKLDGKKDAVLLGVCSHPSFQIKDKNPNGDIDIIKGKGDSSETANDGYGLEHIIANHKNDFKTIMEKENKSLEEAVIFALSKIFDENHIGYPVKAEGNAIRVWAKIGNEYFGATLRHYKNEEKQNLWYPRYHIVSCYKGHIDAIPQSVIDYFENPARQNQELPSVGQIIAGQQKHLSQQPSGNGSISKSTETNLNSEREYQNNFKPYHKSQQSSENTETFNETMLSEDLGSNPNLINDIQDNLREYDKLQGLSLDIEHSNRLKEVLGKITDTLKGSIKGLKVVMNETKESINQGKFNIDLNKITLTKSVSEDFSGFMSNEETYAHELTHAATIYTLKNDVKYKNKVTYLYQSMGGLNFIYFKFETFKPQNSIIASLNFYKKAANEQSFKFQRGS